MRSAAPQLTLIQKPTHPKPLLPPSPIQSTTTHQALPTQLSVQRTIRSGAPQTPSSQQRAMRSPVSTQLSAQKTLFSAAPTQLSLQKKVYPTGSCRLPSQGSSCRLPVQGRVSSALFLLSPTVEYILFLVSFSFIVFFC